MFDTGGMRSASHLELVRGSITTAATLAHQRTLPVVDGLADLLPSKSVQRGSTLAVHGNAATSFGLALVGQAVRDGSFLAVVAPTSFGLASCIDYDIPLRRVVQFVLPADGSKWAQSVAAIIEGFDIVLLADRHRASASQSRSLAARNRERGSVLVRVGGASWPEAPDLRFDVNTAEWTGLGQGFGHLTAREVAIQVAGRRYHGGAKVHRLMLPAYGGGVQPVELVEPIVEVPRVVAAASSAADAPGSRFAGADIDAMLDATEPRSSTKLEVATAEGPESQAADQAQAESGATDLGETDLGAIA